MSFVSSTEYDLKAVVGVLINRAWRRSFHGISCLTTYEV